VSKVSFSFLNEKSGIVDVFMSNPQKYGTALTLAQEVLREPGSLEPKEREIIAEFTSKLNGCKYCNTSHKAFADSIGATDEDRKRLKPILNYVKKLTLSPSSVNQKDYQKVIDAGFSEQQLSDAIGVCAAFNFYNRIVEGHGIKPRNDYSDEVAMINEKGYDLRYANSKEEWPTGS
jgi:uncharacterized peroxidase-related enzyme